MRAHADGRDGIYFVERGSNTLQLYKYSDGKTVDIVKFENVPFTGQFAITPDGKTIVYSKIDQRVRDLMLVENFK